MFALKTSLIAIFQSRQEVIQAVDQLAELDLSVIGRVLVVARSHSGQAIMVNGTPTMAGLVGGVLGMALIGLGITQFDIVVSTGLMAMIALVGAVGGRTAGRWVVESLTLHNPQVEALLEYLDDGQAALLLDVISEEDATKLRRQFKRLHAEVIEQPGQLVTSK